MKDKGPSRSTLFARAAEYRVDGIALGSPPVVTATSVLFDDDRRMVGVNDDLLALQGDRLDANFQYGAISTPTVDALAGAIAHLECASAALMTPSGQSALLLSTMHLAKRGGTLLVSDTLTYSTRALLDELASRLDFRIQRIGFDGMAALTVDALRRQESFCLLIEAPAGFGFEVPDLESVLKTARAANVPTIVDNTWASSVFFQPLLHGADIVVLSLSKLYGGPAGVGMGAIATRDSETSIKLRNLAALFGLAVSPESAARLSLCLSTLHMRAHAQDAATRQILASLAPLQAICRPLHPSVEGHPGHAVWKRSFTGACPIFSLAFPTTEPATLAQAMRRSKLIRSAYGWGGNSSSYYLFDPNGWRQAEPDVFSGRSFVRIYVGLESADDLADDLTTTLASI